jgi:hypothetical protein
VADTDRRTMLDESQQGEVLRIASWAIEYARRFALGCFKYWDDDLEALAYLVITETVCQFDDACRSTLDAEVITNLRRGLSRQRSRDTKKLRGRRVFLATETAAVGSCDDSGSAYEAGRGRGATADFKGDRTFVLSDFYAHNRTGKLHSNETRHKMSASRRKWWAAIDESKRAEVSAALARGQNTPEMRAIKSSELQRRKISQAMTEWWARKRAERAAI